MMSKYINVDDFFEWFGIKGHSPETCAHCSAYHPMYAGDCCGNKTYTFDDICDAVDTMPAADVVEVKHGNWTGWTRSRFYGIDEYGEPIFRDGVTFSCSECGRGSAVKTNYCPGCGARMDGAE